MTSFSWLHIADLHRGMKEEEWLWPGVREIFFDDVKRMYDKCGPWDLVLFTGDLTQKGSTKEFEKVDAILNQLWEEFDKLGFAPTLLAVPGNHDLVRPSKKDPVVQRLRQWKQQPDVRAEFWEEENSLSRHVITQAFSNYTQWWDKQVQKAPNLVMGLLPGDFSITIEKGEAKLGIVGLNTAFLQLTDDDYEGRLILHALQFQRACGGDGPDWARQHHSCLFLTHHPPSWLDDESKQHLYGEIVSHGRFAAHLCGHMHESAYEATSIAGTEMRVTWQTRSLFGLEFFGDRKERFHGYALGKIELQRDTGRLIFWPRKAELQGQQRKIVPDYRFDLNDDQHTAPRMFELNQLYASGRIIPVGGFRVDSFVGRTKELGNIRQKLEKGQGVAIVGPSGIGKSTLGKKLLSVLDRDPASVFEHCFTSEVNTDIEAIFSRLANFLGFHGEDEPARWLSSDDYTKSDFSKRLHFFLSHLRDKPFTLYFDDLHLIVGAPDEYNLLILFHAFLQQLGTTQVLLMGRDHLPDLPNQVRLKGLSQSDFKQLLIQQIPDFPLSEAVSEDNPHLLSEALWNKLGGNPQYLKLFAQTVQGESLDVDAVRGYLEDLSERTQIGQYLLDQVWTRLDEDEQKILWTVSIFRETPRVKFLVKVLQEGRILFSDTTLKKKIRFDMADPRGPLAIDSQGRVGLHGLLKDFCSGLLEEDVRRGLHLPVTWVYELDPSQLSPLEAAYHYFESRVAVKSFELLCDHQYELIQQGQASGMLAQLEQFQATQFVDLPNMWIEVLKLRGRLQRHLGRYKDAGSSYRQALKEVEKLALPIQTHVELLVELSLDYILWNKHNRADELLMEALSLLGRSPDNVILGNIYFHRSQICGEKADYPQMQRHAKESIRLLKKGKAYRALLKAYSILAQAYFSQKQYQESLDTLDEAEAIALDQDLHDSPEMALVYGGRGNCYIELRKPKEAKVELKRAIELNETTGNLDALSAQYQALGLVSVYAGKLKEAEGPLNRGIDLARRIQGRFQFNAVYALAAWRHMSGCWDKAADRLDDVKKVATQDHQKALWNLSQIRLCRDLALRAQAANEPKETKNHWQAAMEHINQAWQISDLPPDIVAELQGVQAEVLGLTEQRLDEALAGTEEALKIFTELDTYRAQTWQAQGLVRMARQEWDESDKAFTKALEFFKDTTDDPFETAHTYYYWGLRYQAEGRMEKATEMWQESHKMFEQIESRDYINLLKLTLRQEPKDPEIKA